MVSEESVIAAKILYFLAWGFFATYYFGWGDNVVTVIDPIDESGWVPDGALAACVANDAYGN